MTFDDKKFPLDFIAHDRNENAAVVIALAVGIFSVLVLYGGVDKFSFAWFVLTATYWIIFAFGVRSIILWSLNALFMTYYRARLAKEIEKDLYDLLQKNPFLKRAYNSMWKDDNLTKSNVVIWAGIISSIVLGAVLWYVIAVDHICIENLTQINATIVSDCSVIHG